MSTRARRTAVGVAAVLLVVVVAGHVVTAVTQRLEFGGFYGNNPADGVSALQAGDTTEVRYTYRPNGSFTFYTSIRNPGHWPVEVTDVSLPGWSGPGFGPRYVVEKLRYGYDSGNGALSDAYEPDRALPWKPVTVAPEAVLTLFVTVKIPDWEMAKGTSQNWEEITVRYRVLGLPQEQHVPIGFLLSVGA
ncbi:MAG TPA: hypothetical protein VFC19_48880 [Candidatus Limnocylindrales bacterium]|nr:hypothetical protein [Candidatus Limnocylindrales bacterium]